MTFNRGSMTSLTTSQRIAEFLNGAPNSKLFLIVAGPLLVVYMLTATWSYPSYNDTFTNSVVAWSLGTNASVYLDDHVDLAGTNWPGWIVEAGESSTGKYPPGAALVAAPVYAVWPADAEWITAPDDQFGEFWAPGRQSVTFPLHPMGPAAITASGTTAVAMGLLALVFSRIGPSRASAVVGGYVAGLGTAAWSVASDQLWQHGPAMMWIALALLLSERHLVSSGFAYGLAILTRPPLAVIAATTGLYKSLRERSVRPSILIGFGALTGLALILAYNAWVFDSASISGGYGSGFTDRALALEGVAYVRNLFYAGFSSDRGLFVFSPFLLVLVPGLPSAWRAAPDWAKGAGIGSVIYLLVQYKANRYSGGSNFPTYRYPLEAMATAAPLLFLSYVEWVSRRPRMVGLLSVTVALAVLVQALGALNPDLL